MNTIIIDFEFTGLDNTYIQDNEILQCKVHCIESGKSACTTYRTEKKQTYGSYLVTGIEEDPTLIHKFSNEMLLGLVKSVLADENAPLRFYGFGTEMDNKMMIKYGAHKAFIHDLQEMARIGDAEVELRMATEGSSMECVYHYLTGEHVNVSHGSIRELDPIIRIYEEIVKRGTLDDVRGTLRVMPWGHCAGMPLDQYVKEYRRAADGYRFNNDDVLADSLHEVIKALDEAFYEDDECED